MGWEFAVLDALQGMRLPVLDSFFVSLTRLGDGGFFWIALGLALLCFPKTRVCGVCVLAALAVGAVATNLLLKPLVARPRPFWVCDTVELLVKAPRDFSFPSGHTQASFAAAGAVWRNNRKWGLAVFVLAALIAFSRLYLYVHFPTDVLFGAALGVCVGVGVGGAVKSLFEMKKKS